MRRCRFDGLRVSEDGQKQMRSQAIWTSRGTARPWAACIRRVGSSRGHEQDPTTEIALRRGPGEDLYLVLAQPTSPLQTAQLKIIDQPAVNWIWLGVGIMLIGTFIALLPERTFAFATSRVPTAR